MKNAIRFILLCLIACSLLVLASCGGSNKKTDTATNTKTSTESGTSTETGRTDTGTNTSTQTGSGTNTHTGTGTNTSTQTDTASGCEHQWKTVPQVEPTCIVSGKTEYRFCQKCGEYFIKPKEIPASGHKKEEIPPVAATCTEQGWTAGERCIACEQIFVEPQPIEAKGHTVETLPAVEPVCGTTGLTEGSWCSVCETVFTPQEVVYGGTHSYDYYGMCEKCDATIGEAIIIVADISSSMKELVATGGTRFSIQRDAIADFIKGLEEYDYIGVVIFDQDAHTVLEIQQAGDEENREALSQEVIYKINHEYYSHYIDKATGEESDIRINFANDGRPGYNNIYVDGEDAKYELPRDYSRGGQDKVTGDYIKSYGTAYLPCMQNASDMVSRFDDIGIEVISKKVLLISDGAPNDKGLGYTELAEDMTKSGVVIDTVSLGLSINDIQAIAELKGIASAGNGSFKQVYDKETISYAIQAAYRKAEQKGIFDRVGDFRFVTIDDAPYLFSYDGNEKNVVFPESYKGAGYEAYDISNILNDTVESVVINGISTIGSRDFQYLTSLKSVTIGNSVTAIEGYAFENCYALRNVIIGDNVTSIGSYAFQNCFSLLSVTLGKGLTTIENFAFPNSMKLVEVYNLSSISVVAGSNSSNNGFVSSQAIKVHTSLDEESILKTTDDGYVFAIAGEDDIRLIAYIGDETELTLPNDYNGKNYKINKFAFYTNYNYNNAALIGILGGIKKITKITIPKAVTEIGATAFYGCTSLTAIDYLGSIEQWCNISFEDRYSNPLSYAKNLYLNGTLVTNLAIPDTITEIKDYTFSGGNFINVTFHSGVTSIGADAFRGCSSLKSVEIPNSVTSIGAYAFYGCSSLESIEMPENLTSIESSTFNGCGSLESIEIPEGVTSIGVSAFYNCTALTDITIPSGVTLIDGETFENCTSLKSVEIPNGVTSIGSDAFRNCTSLKSIEIPSGVTSIGNYAFTGCTALRSVMIPSNVTSIGYNAFYCCTSLLEVYNLSSLDIVIGETTHGYVAYYATVVHTSQDEESIFQTIDGFDFAVLEDNVYLIDYSGEKTELTLPISCNGKSYIIKYEAFKDRDDITKVVINGGVTVIEDKAFYGCDSLVTVEISDTVERIEGNPFASCTSLAYNTYYGANYLGNDTNPYFVLISVDSSARSCTIHQDMKLFSTTAFSSLSSSFYYNEMDNLCYIGTEENPYYVLVKASSKDITACTIQASVKYICINAFEGCNSLEAVKALAGATIVTPNGVWKHGSTTYQAGDVITATEDITLVPVYFGNYQLVSTEDELLEAIVNRNTAILTADISMTKELTGYSYSSWEIYNLHLNGYNITFDSSLAQCSRGQRYGLNIMGKGTVTYEGTGTFAVMNNHIWGGNYCILTIGKDVTINAPNATLLKDSDAGYVTGYPMIEIYGTVVCNNLINISHANNRNPRVEIYDGATVTINGRVSAHGVLGNTTHVNISGGTIISNSEAQSFFDDTSIYEITGGSFYFAYEGDSENLAAIIDTEKYKITQSTLDSKIYYKVEEKDGFSIGVDFGALEQ